MVDGTKQTDMPISPLASNGSYYKVGVSCTSSKTKGLWDYNAWRLNLDYIESNSKCTLTFTSGMSKTDYDKYIQAGIALRRNTYRGKDITSLWKSGDLYTQIADGTFADVYVGDYIQSERKDAFNNKIVWLIADIDNYWHQGWKDGDDAYNTNGLTKHHATIIPAYKLEDNRMNSTNTTLTGYMGSEMYKTTLAKILQNYVTPDFSGHVLSYQNLSSNKVDEKSGASSNWSWDSRQIDLMSEVNVYGTTVVSSNYYDIGLDNRQYAIFQLRPELINQDISGSRFNYWLKAIKDTALYCRIGRDGVSDYEYASNSSGVRPRFLIGT